MYQVFFGENFIISASLFHNKKIKIYYYLFDKTFKKSFISPIFQIFIDYKYFF